MVKVIFLLALAVYLPPSPLAHLIITSDLMVCVRFYKFFTPGEMDPLLGYFINKKEIDCSIYILMPYCHTSLKSHELCYLCQMI